MCSEKEGTPLKLLVLDFDRTLITRSCAAKKNQGKDWEAQYEGGP